MYDCVWQHPPTEEGLMPQKKKKQAAIPFILITILIDVLGIGLIIPILPELITEFAGGVISQGSSYYGLFIAVFAAMQFLFAPILGGLSDKYGRRPVLLVSLLGAGLDYLLMALAPALWVLFVGRVLAGITSANLTVANAYIADISKPEDRAKNFGLIGAVFGIGFIIGPALGGLLGNYGLRLPFYAAALLALVNWLYGYFVLPESLAPEHRREFSRGQLSPLSSLHSLARYPVVAGLAVTLVCVSLAQNALQSTWVLLTTFRFDWGPLQNGLSLAVVGILTVIVQGGLVRVLVPKLGERRAILVGLTISVISMTLYGMITRAWMIYPVMVIGSLAGIAGPAIQSFVSRQVSASEQGSVQGALASLMSLTGVIGPLAATQLFAVFTAPAAAVQIPGIGFYFGAVMSLAGVLFAFRTFRKPAAGDVAAA
jgi:DHA1 family tetracycline resistance protein-like MFS transporter